MSITLKINNNSGNNIHPDSELSNPLVVYPMNS